MLWLIWGIFSVPEIDMSPFFNFLFHGGYGVIKTNFTTVQFIKNILTSQAAGDRTGYIGNINIHIQKINCVLKRRQTAFASLRLILVQGSYYKREIVTTLSRFSNQSHFRGEEHNYRFDLFHGG